MIIDMKHGLSYCRHGKVGTTTLLYHFSHLTNISEKLRNTIEKQDQHAYSVMHTSIPNKFKLRKTDFTMTTTENKKSKNNNEFFIAYNDYLHKNNVLSFSFVRHPFERLASAYEDKVLNNGSGAIKKLHTNFHNFSSFVDYV